MFRSKMVSPTLGLYIASRQSIQAAQKTCKASQEVPWSSQGVKCPHLMLPVNAACSQRARF